MLDGLCVTGSDDRLLRVWPLDFRDYLLEVGRGRRPVGQATSHITALAWHGMEGCSEGGCVHFRCGVGLILWLDAGRLALHTRTGRMLWGCHLHSLWRGMARCVRLHGVQAEHEGGVTAVGVSPDGLRVAIGTEAGVLGVLDIPSHHYETLLRSHCGAVNCVAADPQRYGVRVTPFLRSAKCYLHLTASVGMCVRKHVLHRPRSSLRLCMLLAVMHVCKQLAHGDVCAALLLQAPVLHCVHRRNHTHLGPGHTRTAVRV